MNKKFSLIYPTRHRPQFIDMVLKFLERQDYSDFEIIISDNYLDESLSCEEICRAYPLLDIKYIKPTSPLSMVANWNFALHHASGDYICYFTDKMFLLPGTLAAVNEYVKEANADIVNWVDNKFTGVNFPDYFGVGFYREEQPGVSADKSYNFFSPTKELQLKAKAAVSRNEQSASQYARGKICFGAYKRELVDRIIMKTGQLFHDISPDYTSMILGLSFSESAIEINRPGIVHVNTDLSNGGLGLKNENHSLSFLRSLESYPEVLNQMLVPGVYSCPHNSVARDFIYLKRNFKLNYHIDKVNWAVYIYEDLYFEGKSWSSVEVEVKLKGLYENFLNHSLTRQEKTEVKEKIAVRKKLSKNSFLYRTLKKQIRTFLPQRVLLVARDIRMSGREIKLNEITEILDLVHS